MEHYRQIFNGAGWFIPPYVRIGYLMDIAREIIQSENFNLEKLLSHIYTEKYLASMVLDRYPHVPHIQNYSEIIKEAVEAHFLGLDHVAVSGLIPVVEGAGRKILQEKGLSERHVKDVFVALSDHCKKDVIENKLGAVGEIVQMLDSFVHFVKENLYVNSEKYTHSDKTNRHGILHGAFSDHDYGSPLNFYKVIGAVDFLSFVVSIRAPISFFAPEESPESEKWSMYLLGLSQLNYLR